MNNKFVSLLLVLVTVIISGCGVSSYRSQIGYDMPPVGVGMGSRMDPREAAFGPAGVPPKYVGFLDYRPRSCGNGPLSLEIKNESGNFVSVQFDGLDVHVQGAQGELPPFIPPPDALTNAPHTLFICMDELGQHTISGTQYALSGSRMVKLFNFHWSGELTRSRPHTSRIVGGSPGILL